MQLRTFQSESDFFADYCAYSRGDMQAGKRIAVEMRASGATLSELARAAAQYQRDAANPMAKVYAESAPVTQQDWHDAESFSTKTHKRSCAPSVARMQKRWLKVATGTRPAS